MRTLICVPCMDTVHTLFMVSLLSMRKAEGTEVSVSSCSLVYDARHVLAHKAIREGYDRILWLDSDMRFDPDLMEKLSEDMDTGLEFVSAVYFTRKKPVKPCIYDSLCEAVTKDGKTIPYASHVKEIPDGLFEIEGCGFGAVMMTTELIRKVGDLPFYPMDGYGEDFSFCRRARAAGAKLYCDGRIRADHVGLQLINEDCWEK